MMKKDPFPPEGRGPAEKQSGKQPRNEIKSQKRGKAEWAKPLYQHNGRTVMEWDTPLSPGPFPLCSFLRALLAKALNKKKYRNKKYMGN